MEFCETCPKPQLVELVQGFVKTLGFFVSLEEPTAPMVQEVEQAGFYTTPLGNRKIPRLQIRTVGELLAGEEFLLPITAYLHGVAQAERVQAEAGQGALEME